MRWTKIKWDILFCVLNHPYYSTAEVVHKTELKMSTVRANLRQLNALGYIAYTNANNRIPLWRITESGRHAIIANNKQREAIK